MIDGDVIREVFGPSLGYAEADRVIQIGRIQRLAKFLNEQGLIVIVAALYAHPDLLKWNRINLNNYTEVYLKASMDLLRRRDQKNLYSRASKGQAANVVGIDIPWHAPTDFHLQFSADAEITPVDMARQLAAELGLFDDGVVKHVGIAGS